MTERQSDYYNPLVHAHGVLIIANSINGQLRTYFPSKWVRHQNFISSTSKCKKKKNPLLPDDYNVFVAHTLTTSCYFVFIICLYHVRSYVLYSCLKIKFELSRSRYTLVICSLSPWPSVGHLHVSHMHIFLKMREGNLTQIQEMFFSGVWIFQ